MKLTHENMTSFMERYCQDLSQYGNDAKTMHKMDEYWSPDFTSTAYFHLDDGTYPLVINGRKEFKDLLIRSHTNIKDTVEPRDIIVDTVNSKAVVLLKIKKEQRDTGAMTEIDGVGIYKLIVDDADALKIKSLDFFWHAPPKIINVYNKCRS